ncbi:hypothetical protein K9N68_00155 [Kovacikia minuta CCNUW1]|uniref:hypothetical protein n=1 Tax=Kovacikia minuta TaxID=2931930 RepID=UPI001CCCC4CD|nr:hypothetical protein [Kovacikia minuta]UBF26469.1 hypothetical protein K9N68_00155 [Kovacikia minuta CCNUW1]
MKTRSALQPLRWMQVGLATLIWLSPIALFPGSSSNANFVNQRSLPSIAQQLRSLNLLTESTYQQVIRSINSGEIHNRSELLHYAEEDAQRQLFGSMPFRGAFSISFGGDLKQADLDRLRNFNHRLREAGAISDSVFNHLQRQIFNKEIHVEWELLRSAVTLMEVSDSLQPAQIKPQLDELKTAGVLSEENYHHLLQDLTNESVENSFDLLRYMDHALIFNLRNYSTDPHDYFPKIHRAIAQKLAADGIANIQLENLTVKLVPDKEQYSDQVTFYKALVSANVNDRQYQQASFYAPIDKNVGDNNVFIGRIEPEKFIDLFNKILRDQKSSYRLYPIEATTYVDGTPGKDYSRFAVIALTEQQANYLMPKQLLDIGWQKHDTALTSDRTEQIITLMQKIGLLSHLTNKQIAAGHQQVIQNYMTRPYEILEAFDGVLLKFDFDSKDVENPYRELTEKFAAASHGAFKPTQISNQFDSAKKVVEHFFVIKGKHYSKKLRLDDGELDPEFFTFIDEVVRETVLDGRFYSLYDGSEFVGYIFLTNAQKQALESEGLITLKPLNG